MPMSQTPNPPIYIDDHFTLNYQPNIITPVENWIVTEVKSDNFWKKDYKYIYKIYIDNTEVSLNKLYPSMYDGSSYFDCSNILKNYIDDWVDCKVVGVSWSGNTYPPINAYGFDVYEEYKETATFNAVYNGAYDMTYLIMDSGYTLSNFYGCSVLIQQNNPDVYPAIEGVHYISNSGVQYLVTDVPYTYQGATSLVNGIISKIDTTENAIMNNKWRITFNGQFNRKDWLNVWGTMFLHSPSISSKALSLSSKLLTNYVTTDDYRTLSFLKYNYMTPSPSGCIKFYHIICNDGATMTIKDTSDHEFTDDIATVGVGPRNLNSFTATGSTCVASTRFPIITSATTSYTVVGVAESATGTGGSVVYGTNIFATCFSGVTFNSTGQTIYNTSTTSSKTGSTSITNTTNDVILASYMGLSGTCSASTYLDVTGNATEGYFCFSYEITGLTYGKEYKVSYEIENLFTGTTAEQNYNVEWWVEFGKDKYVLVDLSNTGGTPLPSGCTDLVYGQGGQKLSNQQLKNIRNKHMVGRRHVANGNGSYEDYITYLYYQYGQTGDVSSKRFFFNCFLPNGYTNNLIIKNIKVEDNTGTYISGYTFNSGLTTTQTYTYNVNCDRFAMYDKYTVVYKTPLGGFDYIDMNSRNNQTVYDIQKTIIKKSDFYTYNEYSKTRDVSYQFNYYEKVLISDWLSLDEQEKMKELLISDNIYLLSKTKDDTDWDVTPVFLDTNKTTIANKYHVAAYTLTFKSSNEL